MSTATTNLPALPSSLTPEGNLSRYLQEIRKFPLQVREGVPARGRGAHLETRRLERPPRRLDGGRLRVHDENTQGASPPVKGAGFHHPRTTIVWGQGVVQAKYP